MPLRPRKCCGKNVIFTPINIITNWVVSQFGFRLMPVNRGNQWISPAMIANTAPIEST